MRTTDDWAALLNGTTPGPWRWYWDGGIMSLEGADTMPVATDLSVHDSDLLAAAPEAVAEVVRLRRALARVENELHHVTQHALAQGRKLRAKQLKEQRAREALDKLVDEIHSTSYRPRYDEGMTHAIKTIREALGDTDDQTHNR